MSLWRGRSSKEGEHGENNKISKFFDAVKRGRWDKGCCFYSAENW